MLSRDKTVIFSNGGLKSFSEAIQCSGVPGEMWICYATQINPTKTDVRIPQTDDDVLNDDDINVIATV